MELHGIWIGSLGATVKHPPAESEKLEAYGINIHRNYAADIETLTRVGFLAPGRTDLPPHPIRLPFDWHADPDAGLFPEQPCPQYPRDCRDASLAAQSPSEAIS